jgi:peroxiredoxin
MKTYLTFLLTAFIAFTSIAGPDLAVGDNAPDFKLKNVDGKMVSLKDYKDVKGVIVVFTCNHCPYAKLYENRIMALDDEYRPKGYPVIAINPNDPTVYPVDSYENMQARAKEKGYTFPYLVDETSEVAKAYGAKKTPHVFLLQKEGDEKYKVVYMGAIDNDTENKKDDKVKYVEDAILAIESGKQPDPSSTKAIGCTIKWRE